MGNKHELHPSLRDASLEKACELANALVLHNDAGLSRARIPRIDPGQTAFDLHYMLEYLRLNFDLVPKK